MIILEAFAVCVIEIIGLTLGLNKSQSSFICRNIAVSFVIPIKYTLFLNIKSAVVNLSCTQKKPVRSAIIKSGTVQTIFST